MEKIEFVNKKESKVFDAIINFKPTLNYSILKTALRKKDIRVNGKKINDNMTIKSGDLITIFLQEKKQKTINSIYEDDNIKIVFKPQGVEVTKVDKAFKDSESLEEIVKATACHRLDKNTEGLVVLAKNQTAQNCMFEAFKNHQVQKTYNAIVSGNVNKNGEKLQNYIKKEENFAKICDKFDKSGKIAKLSYKVLEQKNDLFLIEINLETGRMHQIRVQLAHHKIYVLGDEKYGDKEVNKKCKTHKQQLCACKISFSNLTAPLEYLNGKYFDVKPNFNLKNYDIKLGKHNKK